MQPFHSHEGVAVPLDRDDVDTDAILPKQFLRSIGKSGFGPFLFDSWRYTEPGDLLSPERERPLQAGFVLNDPIYASGSVLLVRQNFGCGSSREHAVWALQQHGFRAVVAASLSDIFRTNSLRNGLLAVELGEAAADALFRQVLARPGLRIRVDLVAQTVGLPGEPSVRFEIDPFARSCLLDGLDGVGLTLRHAQEICDFEARRMRTLPWLQAGGQA